MTDSEKLSLILSEMQGMKSEITDMKSEITDMKSDITDMKSEITDMKSDITDMKNEITDMKNEITDMKSEITDIRQKTTKIDLIVENEIRVNIQRVAEGHLDLSRKLNECIKLSSDIKDKQEIQDIYINMHDSKLKVL